MAAPVQTSTPAAGSASDWTVQAADTIETVVGTIRDKTAAPLETVARALVYGLIVAVMGITALILVVVATVRIIEVYLPFGDVWLPYLVAGAIFGTAGMFLWSKRAPRTEG